MNSITHLVKTNQGWGLLINETFHQIPPKWQGNPLEFLELDHQESFDTCSLEAIKDSIQAPILGNPKIVCVGRNYLEHILELGNDPNEIRKKGPVLFLKPSTAIIGPRESIILPPESKRVDHEIELAVIIGKKARNVPKSEAFNHVLGYSVFIDVTARDWQREDKTWFRGKALDSFAPLGPWITLASSDIDPSNLDLQLTVNDKIRQNGNTKDMLFKIDELIALISQYTTLLPGDIIATGTPPGVSPLQNGDQVRATIQNIGTLEVSVKQG